MNIQRKLLRACAGTLAAILGAACSTNARVPLRTSTFEGATRRAEVVRTNDSTNTPASTFSVGFNGIIVLARMDANARRAILVAGDITERHAPELTVPLPADSKARQNAIVALRDVTRNIPKIEGNYATVRIDGTALRIRGSGKPPRAPYDEQETFKCLVPRLREHPVNGGTILPDVVKRSSNPKRAHLPSNPAVAFFEIENGTLSAEKAKDGGQYSNDDLCRPFADIVYWDGVTDGQAVLQMASPHTVWEWKDIPLANAGPLGLSVVNLSEARVVSPHHFALNEKLLSNDLPHITLCKDPAACAQSGYGNRNVVPGCSDTQYP
jgi:hypothetical protein